MRSISLIFKVLLTFSIFVPVIRAQTTLIDPAGAGGFELGATFAANGWTESSGSNNPWSIGTAISTAPFSNNSAYISLDGGATTGYSTSNPATSYFYRDITVPAGQSKIALSFNWQCQGESTWDMWQVFTAPTSVTPTGTNTHPGSGVNLVPSGISGSSYIIHGNLQGTIQTTTVFLPASLAGTTFRLIFAWKSDTSGGTQPPAGIDNISLVSNFPGNYISVASGNWDSPATWGTVDFPSPADNATVSTGHIVTINALNLGANNLTVDGTLEFNTTATTMIVNGNLTIGSSGIFNVFQAGSSTVGKRLNVLGNITNNGTIDISIGGSSTTTNGILNLAGSSPQTVNGSGTWVGNSIRNLLMTNTSTTYPNINWNVNNIVIQHQLNLTGARVDLNGNTILAGSSVSTSPTLTFPSGTGFLDGVYGRYFTTTQTGSAFTVNADPTTTTSQFPFVNLSGQNRSIWIRRSSSSGTGNTAGYLQAEYIDVTGISTITPVLDGSYSIDRQFNGNWVISTSGGYVYASGTHQIATVAPSAYLAANGNTRLMYAASVLGTHENGSVTPGGKRFALTTSDLTGAAWYMGINDADIPFVSIASGDWTNPAIWSKAGVPGCTDGVSIAAGHSVSVTTTGNEALNLTIAVGGTFELANGSLTLGCTNNNNFLINNGTLTVSRGTLTINGNMLHNAGSTFNHSNGDIVVDGNDNGNAATSVASGVSIVQLNSQNINWTGGTLTIVDPHANSTASNSFAYTNSTANVDVTSGHTTRFGNGTSTQPGGNSTNGFRVNTFVGSNRISFNNFEVLGGAGTNRHVTATFTFGINGNLTVQSDGEFRPGVTTYITGDITNNGTITHTSTLYLGTYLGGTIGQGTNPQTISGSGTFNNLVSSPTANLSSLTVNNIGGVSLSIPLTISGTLLMQKGIINTTSVNTLRLGTITAAGTLSTSSVFADDTHINGPFLRTTGTTTATNTFTNTHLFPTGKGGTYYPLWLSPTTTAPTIFTAEAFDNMPGTPGPGVSNLSDNRWEVSANTPSNLTFAHVQLGDASISATNQILQANSSAGAYSGIVTGTLFTAGTPNTIKTNPNGSPIPNASFTGFFAYGDLTPCSVPLNQPNTLVFSGVSSTSLTGTFNPAIPAPDGYIVVRYLTGATPTDPVNGTSYVPAASLGSGTVVSVGTATTFNQTGLTINTGYDYYIYSYNAIGCGGGPVYLTTSPLFGTVTTCNTTIAPITGLATSSRTQTTFNIFWTASATPGVSYFVDVASDVNFTNILQANLSAGTGVTYTISGLMPGTTYHFRVRAFDLASGCFSTNVAAQNGTLCAATNIPYTEDLNGALTCLSVLSTGTGNSWGIVAAPVTPSGMSGNTARIVSSTSAATNNYFVTRAVMLTGGTSYDLIFKYGNSSSNPTLSMDLIYSEADAGNGGIILANNVVAGTINNINNTASQTGTYAFIPPTTGEYYLMFRAFGPIAGSATTLYIDDIEVDETPQCSAADGGMITSSVTGTACGNTNTTNLTSSGYSLGLGMSYQWQRSNDNFVSNIVDIMGATNPMGTTTSLDEGVNYFRLRANCVNGSLEGFSNIVSVTYSNPQPLTTTGGSRCGTGTVDLQATANMGDNIVWYENATGGAPIGTGSPFTTPIINTTTDYYVAVSSGGSTESAARPTYLGTENTSGTQWGLVFDVVNSAITLNTVDVYSVGAGGNLTVELRDNTGTLLQTSAVHPYPSGSTGSPVTVTVPLNFNVPIGTGYRLVMGSMSGNLIRNSSLGGFPYTSNSGNVVVTNGYISGTSTTYYWFYNWSVSTGCEGTRTAVTATVASPPNLTLSSASETICEGVMSNLVTITSDVNDFDTYSWSPMAGVSGNENDGYTFNPVANTTYTLTASQSMPPMCQNVAQIDITVNPAPDGAILPSAPISINCGDIQELNAIIPSESKDYVFVPSSVSFTPISGGTNVDIIEDDDEHSGAIPIGFNFMFENISYTDVYANSNGWLSFNSASGSATTAQWRTNATSAPATMLPLVAPLWDDLDGFDGPGQASYVTTGTAPNRVFTMEWLDWEWGWQADAPVISFQVKLYESTNKIEFVYSDEGGTTSVPSASIGIMTSATNYLMLDGTGTNPMALNNAFTTSLSTKPTTGQQYAFELPTAVDYEWTGPSGTIFTDMAATIPYTGQNVSTVFVQPTTGGTNTYSVEIEGANGCKSTFDKDIEVGSCAIALNTKVFLTNVSSGTMSDVLRTLPDFPLTDPYTTAPYTTSGLFTYVPAQTPATTTLTILNNNNVVDWVFVELRTGSSGSTTVAASKSGLLKNDGIIINPDGTPFSFSGVAAGNYFIAIKHRNHCGFMTNGTFVVPNPSLLNFTNNSVTLYEPSHPALQLKGTGEYAMWTGDAVVNGAITGGDVNFIRTLSGISSGEYNRADVNLNGSVTGGDVNATRVNSGVIFWQID